MDCSHVNTEVKNSTPPPACISIYCNSTACRGARFCSWHCKDSEHGHCRDIYCGESEHIKGSGLCLLHCTTKEHDHCSVNGCGNKKCMHNDSHLCIRHCYHEKHVECTVEDCSDLVCNDGPYKLCPYHCEYAFHGHCRLEGCSEKVCSENGNLCKFHCIGTCKTVNHCRGFKCDSDQYTTHIPYRINYCHSCIKKYFGVAYCREDSCTKYEYSEGSGLCSTHRRDCSVEGCFAKKCDEQVQTGKPLCKIHCTSSHSHCCNDNCGNFACGSSVYCCQHWTRPTYHSCRNRPRRDKCSCRTWYAGCILQIDHDCICDMHIKQFYRCRSKRHKCRCNKQNVIVAHSEDSLKEQVEKIEKEESRLLRSEINSLKKEKCLAHKTIEYEEPVLTIFTGECCCADFTGKLCVIGTGVHKCICHVRPYVRLISAPSSSGFRLSVDEGDYDDDIDEYRPGDFIFTSTCRATDHSPS